MSDSAGDFDLAVVGAGIIGLAVAREFLGRRPGLRAIVLDKESEPGFHQTAHNSGVLIYVQLIDRRIEIVADRGVSSKVPQSEWAAICRSMLPNSRRVRWLSASSSQ